MSSTYVDVQLFRLNQGKGHLSLYHWGDNDVNHWFCKHCGISPFHDAIYEPGKYRVNLGCISGLDSRDLEIKQFDGKNLL